MSKEKTEDVLLSIQVPVSAQELTYLETNAGTKTPGEKLAAYTSWFIKRQARGGVMIEPQDMDYIASLNEGKRFETSKDVVKAIESSIKRPDGEYSYQIVIPQELKASVEDQAKFNSCTVDQLLQWMGTQVLVDSWIFEFVPAKGSLIPLDEAGLTTARRVLGKFNFTGGEVAAALERLEKFEKDQGAKIAKVA